MTRAWTLGSVFVVRHAGMPFDWLEDLGAGPTLLDAAERLLRAEDGLRTAAGPCWPRLASAVEECAPERLPGVPATVRAAAETWHTAVDRFREAHRAADTDATGKLRLLLERPEAAEAVLLSNPDAYRNMLRPLLAHDGPLTSRHRRARRQLYTYVQRFCAKNETVSFFGPMAYGEVDPDLPDTDGAVLTTGAPRTRTVFLSHWAGRALLRAVTRDPAVLADLPFHRTDGSEPAWPAEASAGAVATARTVLAALAPGGTTLRALVRMLGIPAREAASALRLLVAADAADPGLGGGPLDLTPLATLREGLDRLPRSPARDRWLARAGQLESLRAALEAAAPGGREAAIEQLELAFTEITGEPARRAAGATYADRAVFYEEAASSFALRIGPGLADRWEERLRGVLELCTAHGHLTQRAAADAVRKALGTGTRRNLARYAADAAELFPAPGSYFAVAHAPSYSVGEHERHTRRLRELAEQLPGDRYALVDLCPRASAASDLTDADLVVARVHHHLLVPGWLGTMHPDPDRFAAAATRWVDARDGRLVGFDFGRRNKGYYRFPGREVALRRSSWTDAVRPPMRPRDLVAEVSEPGGETGGTGVRLLDPEGREVTAYLPLNDFVKYAPFAALSHPQVLHPVFTTPDGPPESGSAVLPTIAVDGVVLQRPRWRLEAAPLCRTAPYARFLELRRVARRTGHRFLYCRAAGERKPYLVDLESPLAADLAAHIGRGQDVLTAEAMAPAPDELWLRDEQGRRYTCELRVQLTGEEVGTQ